MQATLTKLTVDQVKKRLDSGEPLAFVDSRNPKAWGEARTMLPGAVRVPGDDVAQYLAKIPRDRTVITYCT
jgi:rhodanese-related sulfurtransferase